MNCLSPSTVIPLRRTPLTVGKRGSSLQEEKRGSEKKNHNTISKSCTYKVIIVRALLMLTSRPHSPCRQTKWVSFWRVQYCWDWAWRTPRCRVYGDRGPLLPSRTARLCRGTQWYARRASPPQYCPQWGTQSHMWGTLWMELKKKKEIVHIS